MNRRKALLPIAVFLFALLVGALLLATAPRVEKADVPETVRAVRVLDAIPRALPLVVRSQGTVTPRTESALIPEVSGRVVWTSPSLVSGGFFEEGEPLLRLDRDDVNTALTRARANLARALGEWEHASSNLRRLENLANQDIVSSSQLDDARRGARVAEAMLEESRAARTQAERDVARAEIRAPFSGRVREESVDLGQFVTRGQAVGTIYATDYVEIRLPIPDDQLAFLELPLFGGAPVDEGPDVTLRARFAGAEHEWQGRIVRTEGEIDPKSRLVHVVARVEEPYSEAAHRAPLAIGLFVEAEIEGPVAEDVLEVPRSALREKNELLVVDAENKLRLHPIELLRLDRESALVRAQMPEGMRICVSPVTAFVPGMPVTPVPSGSGAEIATPDELEAGEGARS
jgi:RND family efflux transporter MFP subunit